MRNAVIYARYSSDKQTDQSIEGQLRVCYDYAAKNNINVVKVYVDRAMTGTNDQRADFQRMLSDSEKETFWDLVIVYAIDRFGRNSIEIAVNKQRLKKNNKTLISATQRTSENIDGTKNLDGILLENVYIGLAEYYSAELSQKVKRGLHQNRLNGKFCGGQLLYGYKLENQKIIINEEEARIVRYIYKEYASGIPLKKIILYLKEKGIYHKGKSLNYSKIYHILRSKRYTGVCEINGETYTNIYPQIIPNSLYEDVQLVLKANNLGSHSTAVTYILRGKLICGVCKGHVNAECGTSRNGNVIRYYKCMNRKKKLATCDSKAIPKEKLEDLVFKTTKEVLFNNENLEIIAKAILERLEKNNSGNSILTTLAKEKVEISGYISNVMSAIEQGIITSSTKQRLSELEERLSKVEDSIAVETMKMRNQLTVEKIKEYFLSGSSKTFYRIARKYIDKIIIYDKKIEIYYNFGQRKNPDSKNRDFFEPSGSTRTDMVPLVGVEPTRYRYHGILSPARLPIPPQRLILLFALDF